MKGKAIARLTKELQKVRDEMPPNVLDMHMQDSNMHELFFAFSGPPDTPHAGGVYVLKIQLPKTYPFAPPDFLVLTPNGRFTTNAKICMTFSSFHPETWTPSYTLTTLLVSFVSFFAEEKSNAIGVMQSTPAQKKQYAKESVAWCQRHAHGNSKYADMLPIFNHLKAGLQTEASIKAAMAKRHPQLAAPAEAAAERPPAVDLSAAPASTSGVGSGPRAAAVKAAAGALQPLSPAQQNVARQTAAHKRGQPDIDLAGPAAAPAKKAKAAATIVTLDDDDVVPVAKAKPAAPAAAACVDLT